MARQHLCCSSFVCSSFSRPLTIPLAITISLRSDSNNISRYGSRKGWDEEGEKRTIKTRRCSCCQIVYCLHFVIGKVQYRALVVVCSCVNLRAVIAGEMRVRHVVYLVRLVVSRNPCTFILYTEDRSLVELNRIPHRGSCSSNTSSAPIRAV